MPETGKTILLVEDQDAIRRVLAKLLTSAGHSVLEAHEATAAIHLIDGGGMAIDLAVVDAMLPAPGSEAVADALMRQMRPLRVILISGYSREWIRQTKVNAALAHLPGFRFLEKPFSLQEFLETVADVLGRPTDVVVTSEWQIPE